MKLLSLTISFFFTIHLLISQSQDTCSLMNLRPTCLSYLDDLNYDTITIKEPYFKHHTCVGSVEKFLSRMIMTPSLAHKIVSPNWDAYDPDGYCELVEMCADLNASFIEAAGGVWSKENCWITCYHGYFHAVHQMVKDINQAYDHKHQMRPIIGVTLSEIVDMSDCVVKIQIPRYVRDAFSNVAGFNTDYYYPINDTVYFTQDSIIDVNDIGSSAKNVDIRRIEAQMLYYYQSTQYVDAGIKCIVMGNIREWGRNEISNPTAGMGCSNNLENTARLVRKIREYAKLKETFVLLATENGPYGDLCYPNTDTLMFDYNRAPVRPREVTTLGAITPAVIYHDQFYEEDCDDPEYETVEVLPAACIADSVIFPYQAFIDPCHTVYPHFRTGGKYSPNGCFQEVTPVCLYFDRGGGPNEYDPYTYYSDSLDAVNRVWGWDDGGWFMHLSDECQADWLAQYICEVREFMGSNNSFLMMPGTLTNLLWSEEDPSNPAYPGSDWILSDYPLVVQKIQDLWTPIEPSITIDSICSEPYSTDYFRCGPPIVLRPGYVEVNQLAKKEYTLKVENPDCTSIYNWHVKRLSDGHWLPFTLGNKRTLTDLEPGYYQVGLGQDNHGYVDDDDFIVSVVDTFYFERDCCIKTILDNSGLTEGGIHISYLQDSCETVTLEAIDNSTIQATNYVWDLGSNVNIQSYGNEGRSVEAKVVSSVISTIPYDFLAYNKSTEKFIHLNGEFDFEGCEEKSHGYLIVFPNPVNVAENAIVNIWLKKGEQKSVAKNEPVKFEIFRSYDGKMIESFTTYYGTIQIETSRFHSGVYYVRAIFDGYFVYSSFIILKE